MGAQTEAHRPELRRTATSNGLGPTTELAALAELARDVFSVDRAAVHIVDEDWLRVASQAGIDLPDCMLETSICARVIDTRRLVSFQDLSKDRVFGTIPAVRTAPHFRYYAGVPVELEPGMVVGTFCLLHCEPRRITEEEADRLEKFAVLAGGLLHLQRSNFTMTIDGKQLRIAAITDPLTKVYNRAAVDTIVLPRLAKAMATGQAFGVLTLDMDGFKAINDTHGHIAGDWVIAEAACRIRSLIEPEDVVVRMGGDEFAIFGADAPGANRLHTLGVALVAAFRQPFSLSQTAICARLSIGGAMMAPARTVMATKPSASPGPCQPLPGVLIDLLAEADRALYRAKDQGRDCIVMAEPPSRP